MIERKFVSEKINEFRVREFLARQYKDAGYSRVELMRTPLGVRVVIYASKPGLIVGRKGLNIIDLKEKLQSMFNLDNPQVEVREVSEPFLDANVVVSYVLGQFKKFGVGRFKAIGHKVLQRIMKAGAVGAEIFLSGKIPGKRARTWRFFIGNIPKTGNFVSEYVSESKGMVKLKTGVVGVKVRILPPGYNMPDDVDIISVEEVQEEVKEEPKEEVKENKKETKEEKKEEKKKVEEKKKKEDKK